MLYIHKIIKKENFSEKEERSREEEKKEDEAVDVTLFVNAWLGNSLLSKTVTKPTSIFPGQSVNDYWDINLYVIVNIGEASWLGQHLFD